MSPSSTYLQPTRFTPLPILVLVHLYPHVLREGGLLRIVFLRVLHEERSVTVEADKVISALHVLDLLWGKYGQSRSQVAFFPANVVHSLPDDLREVPIRMENRVRVHSKLEQIVWLKVVA